MESDAGCPRGRASLHSLVYFAEPRDKIWTLRSRKRRVLKHWPFGKGQEKKTFRFCTFSSTFPLLSLFVFFSSDTECPSLGSLPFINLGFTMCSSCIWDDWAEMAGAVGRKGEFGWMGPIHSPHFHAHQDRVPSNPGYEIFSVVCSVYARNVCCLRKQRSLNELPLFKCTRW